MEIDCPQGGDLVKVVVPAPPAVTTACSGAVGTICVRGLVTEGFLDKQKAVKLLDSTGLFVRVRVLNGSVGLASGGSPWPKLPCDVDATPSGAAWCAVNVPVPAVSDAGAPLTVFAWLLASGGSGSGPLPQSQQFSGSRVGTHDCCSGCVSGSAAPAFAAANELASHPDLQVTVPDGKNAGAYKATAVAAMKWRVAVDGTLYTLAYCNVAGWTIQGPSASAPSTSFDSDPFSATFPGAVLEATDEIVVTVA